MENNRTNKENDLDSALEPNFLDFNTEDIQSPDFNEENFLNSFNNIQKDLDSLPSIESLTKEINSSTRNATPNNTQNQSPSTQSDDPFNIDDLNLDDSINNVTPQEPQNFDFSELDSLNSITDDAISNTINNDENELDNLDLNFDPPEETLNIEDPIWNNLVQENNENEVPIENEIPQESEELPEESFIEPENLQEEFNEQTPEEESQENLQENSPEQENTQDNFEIDNFNLADLVNEDLAQDLPNPNPEELNLDNFNIDEPSENIVPDFSELSAGDFNAPNTAQTQEEIPLESDFNSEQNTQEEPQETGSPEPYIPPQAEDSDNFLYDEDSLDLNDTLNTNPESFIDMNSDEREIPSDNFFDSLDNELNPQNQENYDPTEIINNNSLNNDSFIKNLEQQVNATTPNKNFEKNLNVLGNEFANHIHKLLVDKEVDHSIKEEVTEELNKKSPNLFRLEEISGFHLPSTQKAKSEKRGSFSPVRLLVTGLVIFGLGVGIYFSFFAPSALSNNALKKGLGLIHHNEFKQANAIFDSNSPNVGWYNKYATAFMDEGAFTLAEEKLLGVKTPNRTMKKGAIDLDPNGRQTLLNIATLYLNQNQFEKAFTDDAKIAVPSLSYLNEKYPRDMNIKDFTGKAYIKWAQFLQNPILQKQKFEKAGEIYFRMYKEDPKNTTILSRMLEVSLFTNENLPQRLNYVSSHHLQSKLDNEVLSELLTYYLNKEEHTNATIIFNILRSRIQKVNDPKVFYTLGQYYMQSGDLNSAESNFIKGTYLNSIYDKNDAIIAPKNSLVQAKIDNALGQIYLKLIPQYNSGTPTDIKQKDRFTKLARYHFNQAQKFNPSDEDSYYLSGNFYYNIDKNYPKAVENLQTAYSMYKKENKAIPMDLSYNLGNSLYKTGQFQNALTILSDVRSDNPLSYPSLEYLLGMTYLNTGVGSEAIQKLSNALDYYADSLHAIREKTVPRNIRDNQILYFTAIINNNLGTIYQKQGEDTGNPEDKNKARTYFYQAVENANRINRSMVLTNPSLNLQNSLFEDNLQFVQNFGVAGRSTLVYNFTPESAQDYL